MEILHTRILESITHAYCAILAQVICNIAQSAQYLEDFQSKTSLFNDPTRDSIANNFVISVYCRCLQILYQITFFYKIYSN